MRKYLLLILVLNMGLTANTQATIFEILALPPGGCSLDTAPTQVAEEEWPMEEVAEGWVEDDGGPQAAEEFPPAAEALAMLSNWMRSERREKDRFLEGQVDWKEDLCFFLEDGKWGLRKGRRKQLIKPRFDHITAQANHPGFVAYQDGRCNYYLPNGKPQLPEDYLYLQPLIQDAFIVLTPTGYGLLGDQGQELLPPTQLGISPLFGDEPYLKVRYEEEKYYWLNLRNGKKTYYNHSYYDLRFFGDRYVLVDEKTLLDLEESRVVFCGESLSIKLIDKEKGYLAIAATARPNEKYIINAKGELISELVFATVDAYLPTGHFVVGFVEDYDPSSNQQILTGLINEQGEWTVPARYNRVESKLYASKYLQFAQSGKEIGLVSLSGEEPLDRRAYTYFGLEPDGEHLKAIWKEGSTKQAELLNVSTHEITPLAAPGYWNRTLIGKCGEDNLYRAHGEEGQMLLNKKGEPLLSIPAGFIVGDDRDNRITIKRKMRVAGRLVNIDEVVDCSGQAILPAADVTRQTMIHRDLFLVQKTSGEIAFQFADGQEIPATYNWKIYSTDLGDEYFVLVNENGRKGIINAAAEVVVPPIFETIYFDQDNGLILLVYEGRKHYLLPNGELLFKGEYNWVNSAGTGLFFLTKNGKTGIGRMDGTVIVPALYTNVSIERGIIVGSDAQGEWVFFDFAGQPLKLN